ncbi:MAG: RDD family protein [Microbacteriaceae bacterium]|nr:RDD family protein [Microbacteriaceae bacterium]
MSKNARAQKFGDLAPSKFPGERLGLPEFGELSVARVGRRVVAISLDWAMAWLLAVKFLAVSPLLQGFVVLGVFALLQMLFIPTLGGSLGHRMCGLRVVPLVGGWVGVWRPAVRTLLLCLVVPLLVWDSDQRAFHDKIAGTVLVRSR